MERAYFAVFDGHGGVDAARYAAVHVHANAARRRELSTDPARALREAFRCTDEMFLWKAKREVRIWNRCWAQLEEGPASTEVGSGARNGCCTLGLLTPAQSAGAT